MIEALCDKLELLPFDERLKFGDHIIELADKYLSVQVNVRSLLFPTETYHKSLFSLSDILF